MKTLAEVEEMIGSPAGVPKEVSAGSYPAFPTDDRGDGFSDPGMTKREYIAVQFMAALLAYPETRGFRRDVMAFDAVQYADALLTELAGE